MAQSVNTYGDVTLELDLDDFVTTATSTATQTASKYSIVFGLTDTTATQDEVYYLKDIKVKHQVIEV